MSGATAPTVYVLAGPNGAGKTSLYWYEASEVPRLNGDSLYQQGHNSYAVEATLREQLNEWVTHKTTFVIETNAANERDYDLFNSLKKAGYQLELRYVGLESPAMCAQRVAQRVLEGGHDVPAAFIEHRYASSLSLLKRHYRIFDRLQLYDNSDTEARLITDFTPGLLPPTVAPTPAWAVPTLAHIAKMEAVYQRLKK